MHSKLANITTGKVLTACFVPQAYFSKWGDSGVVDLKEEFGKLIALTAARTLLGREIREQLFDEVSCNSTGSATPPLPPPSNTVTEYKQRTEAS